MTKDKPSPNGRQNAESGEDTSRGNEAYNLMTGLLSRQSRPSARSLWQARRRFLLYGALALLAIMLSQCAHPPPVTAPPVTPPVQPVPEVKEEGPYNILSYSIDTRRNGILIEILLREPLQYAWFLTDGEWINLTFERGRLDPQQMQASRPHPEVTEVIARQFDSSAQLSFRMSKPVEKYIVTTDPYSPKRVLVMITGSFHGEVSSPRRSIDSSDSPWVVVLDPGHGGRDRGAVGHRRRTLEKDITLSIAERAAKLLERDARFRVILTRSGDGDVPAKARSRIAREARSSIFVSIHASSSRTVSVHGCKTYCCGKGSATRTTGTPVKAGGVDSGDAVTNATISGQASDPDRSSRALARLILDKIASSTQSPCLGVGRRDSPVLTGANCTSVLVSAGFLSNPADEALLRKKSYQARIAEAIYLGLAAYRDQHDHRELTQNPDAR